MSNLFNCVCAQWFAMCKKLKYKIKISLPNEIYETFNKFFQIIQSVFYICPKELIILT